VTIFPETKRIEQRKLDAFWKRFWAIRDSHANGYAEPILWHMALRGDPGAMVSLSQTFEGQGPLAAPWSQAGLCRRAWRQGYAFGAQHLAMAAFNRRDLGGYRYWLRRAANAGDPDALAQLKRFELRLPHANARSIGRKRPWRKAE
jgi:hypothetical protein